MRDKSGAGMSSRTSWNDQAETAIWLAYKGKIISKHDRTHLSISNKADAAVT